MTLIDMHDLGGPDAPCAVCGDPTTKRLVAGDAHVPMCSGFCDHAWPNVSRLLAALDRIARNDTCNGGCGKEARAALAGGDDT